MKAPAFRYVRPETLEEALSLLAEHGEAARPIAGGQSLVPALNLRLADPSVLIDIGRLAELRGVVRDGAALRLGALTRHAELLTNPAIGESAPLLARAAADIAHPAIRSRGTLGGSLAHADPAAELPACILALGARLHAQSAARGARVIAAEAFFTGLFATALLPDELLVGVELDVPRPDAVWGFGELTRRSGDYAMIGLAAHGARAGESFAELRLAFFSAGPTPMVAARTAGALSDRPLTPDAFAAAETALAADLTPHDDLQARGATRLRLASVLLRRVVGGMAPRLERAA